jgi:hypothetical protein
VRIEKIVCTVLNDAHEQQVKEVMYTLSEGAGSSTGKALSFRRNPSSYRGGRQNVLSPLEAA